MSYWPIITIFPSNIYTKFEQIDKNLNSECIHCQQPRNPREMPTEPQGSAEPRLRNTGLVIKADGSWPWVVGSNPGIVFWMDVINNASFYIKEKSKVKVAKWGAPKKIFWKFFLLFGKLAMECSTGESPNSGVCLFWSGLMFSFGLYYQFS